MAVSQVRAADIYMQAAGTAARDRSVGQEQDAGRQAEEQRRSETGSAGPAVVAEISSRAREAAAAGGEKVEKSPAADEGAGGRIDAYV